jgi:hypothetical protein
MEDDHPFLWFRVGAVHVARSVVVTINIPFDTRLDYRHGLRQFLIDPKVSSPSQVIMSAVN